MNDLLQKKKNQIYARSSQSASEQGNSETCDCKKWSYLTGGLSLEVEI